MSEEMLLDITPPSSPLLVVDKGSLFGTKENPFGGTTSFHWFTCVGDAKLGKLNLHENGYIKSNEISIFNDNEPFDNQRPQPKNVTLFDENLDFGSLLLLEKSWLFRKARTNFIVLYEASKMKHSEFHLISEQKSTQDFLISRKEILKMFFALREYLCWTSLHNHTWALGSIVPGIEEELKKFRLFLGKVTDFQEHILHRGVSQQGYKCLDAPYHLFHCSLDIMWLHLTAVYQLDKIHRVLGSTLTDSQHSQLSDMSNTSDKTSLHHYVLALVGDLIDLALTRFEKTDIRTLLTKSPFTCNCVAELWVLLQQMTSKLHPKGVIDNFWSFVNRVVDGMLVSKGTVEHKQSSMKLLQKTSKTCSNVQAFSLWFLKHTAMLYSQDISNNTSDYPLLESIMKSLLSTEVAEANMRVYLALLEKTVIKYWEPKSEIIIQLWEYFQKRLNNTFYVPGSNLHSMAIMSESVIGMVLQVKTRLSSQYKEEDSFNMFLRLIGLHLQRVTAQSQHWNQIRGRIYSKLSASKVQALTEMGLYHLTSLFLTLAVTADLSEVNKKMQSLLSSVAQGEENLSLRHLVWRTHLSFCLLMAERGIDFAPALSPLTTALIDSQQINTPLVRTYIEGLRAILETSPNLKTDHNILLGSWIPKYLAECSQNDAVRLMELIVTITQRVQKQPEDRDKFQSSVWQYVSAYLRQHINEESILPLADVSINLSQLSQCYSDTLRDILNLFLNNPSTHISLVRRFLCLLVQKSELLLMLKHNSTSTESIEVLIIKGWMRCSLLSLQDYKSSELSRLTSCVTYLDFVSDISMDLTSASDPLLHFIVAVSNKFKTTKDICERSSLRQRISRLLNGTDKWVESYMKHSKSPEILTRIYHIIGLIFSLMPSFIYVKSRPNTVMQGLLDTMFLQVSAYKSNFEPISSIKSAISSSLHLYIKGLADLAMMKDSYVERCIEDLVKIYLPWVSRCNLHECIASADSTAKLILNTVCVSFIRSRASSPHPHCSQALKLLSTVATTYSRELNIMLLLIETCFERVCDMVMFCEDHHGQKNEAKQFLSLIFECRCYGDQTSSKVIEKLQSLCQAHLSFSPGKLFALFHEVMQHRPEIIARLFTDLQNQIKIVESKRGIILDHSLRTYLEKLEDALKSIRNGT